MKLALPILVVALALAGVSCKVGPNYSTPASNVASQWQASPAVTNRPCSAAEEYWWRYFDDPVLDQLVETAFRNNLSLQAAGVRGGQRRGACHAPLNPDSTAAYQLPSEIRTRFDLM